MKTNLGLGFGFHDIDARDDEAGGGFIGGLRMRNHGLAQREPGNQKCDQGACKHLCVRRS